MHKKLTMTFAAAIFSAAIFSADVQAQTTWTAFWTKFKAAVVKNDKATVLNLSKESLSDADYKQMFGTKARQNCFAKAKPIKDRDSYSVFCGEQGYSFEKVGGQFKFVEGFAND